MNPIVKYTAGRLTILVVLAGILLPIPMPISNLVKLMIALLGSMVLSFLLLKKWRDEMSEYIAGSVNKRKEQKEKLRSALAGEDEEDDVANRPDAPVTR